jgi:hypothetical protein
VVRLAYDGVGLSLHRRYLRCSYDDFVLNDDVRTAADSTDTELCVANQSTTGVGNGLLGDGNDDSEQFTADRLEEDGDINTQIVTFSTALQCLESVCFAYLLADGCDLYKHFSGLVDHLHAVNKQRCVMCRRLYIRPTVFARK